MVPIGSADNVTNFATLQAALATPGLNPGDIIQIEPGSAPGNIVNADLPAVAGLTVRGDPTALLSAIPQFTVSDLFTVGAAQEGFTFRNVNIGLIRNPGSSFNGPPDGTLVFTADGTIAGSAVVDVSSGFNPVTGQHSGAVIAFEGVHDVLTDSTISSNPAANGVRSLLAVVAPNGSSTLVSDNVFDMSNIDNNGTGAVSYRNSNFSQISVVTDQLTGNTFFTSNTGGILDATVAIDDQGSLSGLTIQDNTISEPSSDITAIKLSNDITGSFGFQNTQVIGNVINLAGGMGVRVDTGFDSASVFIAGNQINAGTLGSGVFFGFSDNSSLNAVVQGNDFHNDGVGVEIRGLSATASAAVIDLGGGSLGSLGGNDFRSYTATATASSGAIVLNAFPSSQGVITAQKDSFAAGVDPKSVTWDGSKMAGLANVDESNNLTGNAAFVAALYADILKRAGDTSDANDAGGLIALLNSGALTQAAAATAYVHSAEALAVQVDGLYLKLLGRPSDAPGRAGFVSFLRGGGSLEQVIVLMVTSPEYAALTGSDAGFVQSLYKNLLGRAGADSEVAGYLAVLPSQGRAGVAAAFARSTEFRTNAVQQFYSATSAPTSVAALLPSLLHRAGETTTAEINGYVFSGLSLLDIETAFVSSPEFFVNG